jgi:hypothetical protein
MQAEAELRPTVVNARHVKHVAGSKQDRRAGLSGVKRILA